MGVNSLPKTVTRQRRVCDFWTQVLLRMSPAWVLFLVYNTGLVHYRWTGLDLLTADQLKMQDWKIVTSSKYTLSCCTYVFHRCIFVLTYSVLAYSILRYFRFPYLRFQSPRLEVPTEKGKRRAIETRPWKVQSGNRLHCVIGPRKKLLESLGKHPVPFLAFV